MPEPGHILDPELELLLRELAADPRSSLLRVPRSGRIRQLFPAEPLASHTGFSKLERHLLQAYRSELALLLRQACQIRLFEKEACAARTSRRVSPESFVDVPEESMWRRRAADRSTSPDAGLWEPDASSLLSRCASDGLEQTTSVELAAASLRLEPTDSARVYAGLGLANQGRMQDSERILRDVMSSRPTYRIASFASMDLGYARSLQGELPAACDAYREASDRWPEHMMASASWLVLAIQVGDRVQARIAASRVDETIPVGHPWIQEFGVMHEQLRSAQQLEVSPAGINLARWLLDRTGPNSARISHVLA